MDFASPHTGISAFWRACVPRFGRAPARPASRRGLRFEMRMETALLHVHMCTSVGVCRNERGEAVAPPNRIAAEDPLHESRDAHDCAPGRIGPRAAVPSQCDHCASPGFLRATPYACFHDECVVRLSEKKPVRRVSLHSENAFRVGRMARFYPSGTGWKRPRPMGHPRGMIPPMRTWYAGHRRHRLLYSEPCPRETELYRQDPSYTEA